MVESTTLALTASAFLSLRYLIERATTFILIAAVAIYRHIPTERVLCILFLSRLESAKVFHSVSFVSSEVGPNSYRAPLALEMILAAAHPPPFPLPTLPFCRRPILLAMHSECGWVEVLPFQSTPSGSGPGEIHVPHPSIFVIARCKLIVL